MNKSYKLINGTIENRSFITILYDNFGDEEIDFRLEVGLDHGLDKFFKGIIRELKLENKRKKESDFGYLSLTGSSSGGGGQ